MPKTQDLVFCRVVSRVFYPYRNLCKFCTFTPGTSASSVRPWQNARSTRVCPWKNIRLRVRVRVHYSYASLPGTCVSAKEVVCRVRAEAYPGYYSYPELLQVLYARGTPGVRLSPFKKTRVRVREQHLSIYPELL